ncbi:hypothetical protein TWF191_002169 [Orbilia oligospora]|uniref:Cation efflux protein transmembrane domain-containing protein n=1 Tax=Orbilia oligospora TaxID=2813651 RepID=A0A7C8QAM0_ORBOL|nr:hypothetical protein TWF191_002169 [Orbilia oligospora]
MAISKGFGGWYFHSQALIADAMHALTDLVSDFMTLATVSWALKPPTKMFPNGFGKVESLGSLGVSTMKIAKERKSSVLASNAVHHRIDSLTAMVALISISLSNILQGASWLDPVGGLLVSLMVIRAGWSNSRAALFELADMGIDDEMCYEIKKVAENTLKAERLAGVKPGVAGKVKSVGGIKSGQNFLVDITVALEEATVTLEDMARIEGMLREQVGEGVRGVRKVRVKFIEEGKEEVSEFVERGEEDLESESGSEAGHSHENGGECKHGEKKKEK